MKNISDILESLLDDEDVLINQTRDTGVDSFSNTIGVITNEVFTRIKKASKDKRLKELKFPSEKEIHESLFDLFKNVVANKKTVVSKLKNYIATGLRVYYTGKLSARELNDIRPTTKEGWIDYAEESKILNNEYFERYNYIKLKSDVGNIQIEIELLGYWNQDGNDPYLPLRIKVNYSPSVSTVKSFTELNKKVCDVFGHEIHEGDWCAGTQLREAKIIYGPVKFTKARDKVYIYDGSYDNICELYNCIVIKHNNKSINFNDVKDNAFGSR